MLQYNVYRRHLDVVGVLQVLDAVRPVATMMTRLRLDAHLVAPAPHCLPRQNGRPPVVGNRLPTLGQVRANPATAWTSVTLACCYGDRDRRLEYVSRDGPLVSYGLCACAHPLGPHSSSSLATHHFPHITS
jgi:hypothetical protein